MAPIPVRRFSFEPSIFGGLVAAPRNVVQVSSISSSATFNNPTSMTLESNQFNGPTLNRLTPSTAGLGAATAASAMRNIQLEARFQF
jgi:hypothetical protein